MRTSFVHRLHVVALMLASSSLHVGAFMLATFSPLAGPPLEARAAEQPSGAREIEIVVEGQYSPAQIVVSQGEQVRLKFVRKEWNGCTRELVFPGLGLRRELPTNKPVVVELPPLAPGEYEFRCGMNMIRGVVVVTAG